MHAYEIQPSLKNIVTTSQTLVSIYCCFQMIESLVTLKYIK